MMVDAIAEAEGISINTVNFKAQIGKGTFQKKVQSSNYFHYC